MHVHWSGTSVQTHSLDPGFESSFHAEVPKSHAFSLEQNGWDPGRTCLAIIIALYHDNIFTISGIISDRQLQQTNMTLSLAPTRLMMSNQTTETNTVFYTCTDTQIILLLKRQNHNNEYLQGTFITWIDCNMSETAMTRSPDFIIPLALSKENVRLRLLSMSSEKLRRKGMRPHCRFRRLLTDVVDVNANIGQSGRQRDRREAMCPIFV